jgi:hypothetical protein
MSGFTKARGIQVLIRVVTGATMTFASPIDLWHNTIEGKGIGDQKAGPKGFNFLIFKK